MKSRYSRFILSLFTAVVCGQALGTEASPPEKGLFVAPKAWATLEAPVASAPDVVEFFSFYCPPCYQFAEQYPVAKAVDAHLPAGKKMLKYHVDAMGPLGNALTEAWAVATVLGRSDELEIPLFDAVQRHNINSTEDILRVFSQAGIDAQTYHHAQQSIAVRGLVAQQHAAAKAFGVTATPSFYVQGKYRINPQEIAASSPSAFVTRFAELVAKLVATGGMPVSS